MMTAERRRGRGSSKGKTRVGIGQADEHRQRAKVRGNTGDPSYLLPGPECGRRLPLVNEHTGQKTTYLPSEPWVDVHFHQIEDIDADGDPIIVRYFDRRAKASPLNGSAPAMVRCPKCGHLCPPEAVEGGRCMDHRPERVHDAYGSSPSAHAIHELQRRNLRPDFSSLAPEDKSSLRREINRYEQTGILPK